MRNPSYHPSHFKPQTSIVLWPSGEGNSLTRRRSVVRVHPGLLGDAQIRQLEERAGLNPDVCRFDSCSGHCTTTRLGRQLADHPDLESGMLWVRPPPGPLNNYVLVEQPGVLACLSRRRSWVQIPSGTLLMNMARYANPAERPSSNLGDCGFDSLPCYLNMRRLGIGRPRWL